MPHLLHKGSVVKALTQGVEDLGLISASSQRDLNPCPAVLRSRLYAAAKRMFLEEDVFIPTAEAVPLYLNCLLLGQRMG